MDNFNKIFEEEATFNTTGSSIDEAFSDFEIEDDCDEMDEDDYRDNVNEM